MATDPKKKRKITTSKGYDSTGRAGQITQIQETTTTQGKSGGGKSLKQARKDAIKKGWVDKGISQSDYNKKAKAHKDYSTSGSPLTNVENYKSFKPDKKTIPGEPAKPGTSVSTFTAPDKRESLRTTKIAARGEKQRGRKAVRSARKLGRMLDKTGSIEVQGEQGKFKTLSGDEASNFISKQKARGKSMIKGGGTIAQSQFSNNNKYTASDVSQGSTTNARDKNKVEAYGSIDKPKAATSSKQVDRMATEQEKKTLTNYDDVPGVDTSIMSPNKGSGDGFGLKSSHSPSKTYNAPKEKSQALTTGKSVDPNNKISFSPKLFKEQSRSARPMSKNPFKSK